MGNPPAPYPEVDALLQELLQSVQTILGTHFVAAYLLGSLTSGDFDRHSDLDVVFVTDDELPGDLFLALQAMHARIAAGDSWWATQLEVSYIPRQAIRRQDAACAVHPHIDRGKGETLRMMRHDSDWVIQRYTLREHGITLAGPDPKTLIDPLSPNDLRQAMLAIMWWPAQILDDPAPIKKRGYQSYIVITMCRVLYTLQFGTVASKPVASRWALETLDQRWRPLIERAVDGRQHPDSEAPSEDLSGTMDLIKYMIERSREFGLPANDL